MPSLFVALAEHGKFRACASTSASVTCVLYNYCQNGEQVSKTVLTLRFQLVSRGPPGSWHAAVSARAILACFQVAPSNHEDLEAVQRRSVTEGCSACHRMEESSRARSAHIACVKMCKYLEIISDKKKRVRSRACALTRRTNV